MRKLIIPTIIEIIYGKSLSGNAGCNNGNYDIPVCIRFSDGTCILDYTCRCGCGCNDTFRVRGLDIGDSAEKVLAYNLWTYAEERTTKEIDAFFLNLHPDELELVEELEPLEL